MITDMLFRLTIFQFGVGGNGSWLVGPLCKFLNSVMQRVDTDLIDLKYIIIDDDVVEDRNILRQNFEPYDIGRKKISALLRRYCSTYNGMVAIDQRPDTKKKIENIITKTYDRIGLPIVIGCSDNNKTRRAIFNYFNKLDQTTMEELEAAIYIDAGNNLNHGQITTCAWFDSKRYYSDKDWIYFKNERTFENPKFLKMFPLKGEDDPDDQGCAFYGDQSLTINMFAATQVFANIQRLFIDCILPPNVKEFNSTGYATFNI